MTAGNRVFERKQGAGWRRGLDNLLAAELGRWFHTKKWWVQTLVWAALINLLLLLVVVGDKITDAAAPVTLFNAFLGIFAAIGVCILMQGVIIGEKQSGTAAWVLSKPVSRPAFVLAKLIANTTGIALTVLLVQGLIAYLIIFITTGTALPPLGFLGGLGAQLVYLFFYITLTLMLGSAFGRRGPVVAIPLVFLFVQELLLGPFPVLVNVLPHALAMPLDDSSYSALAIDLMNGSSPFSYLPLAATLGVSLLFVALAVWIFHRLEF